MKKKDKQSLSDTTLDALGKKLDEKQKELLKIAYDHHATKSKNSRARRFIRKDIAIIQTYMQEKRLTAS